MMLIAAAAGTKKIYTADIIRYLNCRVAMQFFYGTL
jgi:hypothetical protein